MAYVVQNREDIEAKLKTYFELAGLGNLVSGTPEHALWQMLSDNMYKLYSDLESAYATKLPLNATGETLDLWASFFNITRKNSIYALDDSNTNVHFYIADSDRAGVNAGAEVVIPADTEVSVNGNRKYKTLTQTTIPAVGSPPYVGFTGVRAMEVGTYNNVSEEELNTHNLAEQFPTITGIENVSVVNKYAIQSGAFPQLDSALQNELQNVFGKEIGTNLEGLLSSVRAIAGVAGVDILESKRGTGTFSVFVDSVSPIISTALITQVQSLIDAEKPIGTQGYVEYPTYKAFKFLFEILPVEGSTYTKAVESLKENSVPNILSVINNIGRGGQFAPINVLDIITSNPEVATATIKELKIGEYSIVQNKILNSEFTGTGSKELEWDEKFFISSDLISFCEIVSNS